MSRKKNIWRHSSQEFSKIKDRHQTIDPRISENTKKKKFRNKNKTKSHTYTYHTQAAKSKDKILKTKITSETAKLKCTGTKTKIITDFSFETSEDNGVMPLSQKNSCQQFYNQREYLLRDGEIKTFSDKY